MAQIPFYFEKLAELLVRGYKWHEAIKELWPTEYAKEEARIAAYKAQCQATNSHVSRSKLVNRVYATKRAAALKNVLWADTMAQAKSKHLSSDNLLELYNAWRNSTLSILRDTDHKNYAAASSQFIAYWAKLKHDVEQAQGGIPLNQPINVEFKVVYEDDMKNLPATPVEVKDAN